MSTADDLQRAYQLIREEKPQEAEALLLPILMDDSENVDAWWLMAYAVEDPNEVREALNKVLEIDPNYAQASKAREMLAQLDAEHPPVEEPTLENDLFGDGPIDDSFFDSSFETGTFDDAAGDLIFDDGLDEDFASSLAPPEGMMTADELFGDEDEDIFGRNDVQEVSKPATVVKFESDEPMDDEARAALEEKAARREGRGRRWLIMALFVLIVFGIPAAIILFLLSGGEAASDPGPLEPVTVASEAVNNAQFNAANELRAFGAENQAVIAKSSLGNTLFAKICAQPGPALSDQVWKAMDAVARQSPLLGDELAAIGVSVENCSDSAHDTYYRVFVPIVDALRYMDGEFSGDMGAADFQALWQES